MKGEKRTDVFIYATRVDGSRDGCTREISRVIHLFLSSPFVAEIDRASLFSPSPRAARHTPPDAQYPYRIRTGILSGPTQPPPALCRFVRCNVAISPSRRFLFYRRGSGAPTTKNVRLVTEPNPCGIRVWYMPVCLHSDRRYKWGPSSFDAYYYYYTRI